MSVKTCKGCGGSGTVKRFASYSTNMKNQKKIITRCEDCDGYGKINVIKNPYPIIRQSVLKEHLRGVF